MKSSSTSHGDANQPRRIGFMGGTFDPIHHGHLVTAESVYDSFNLERVIFIPAGTPPHKPGTRVTSAHHRLNMTRLAVRSNPHFAVSEVEVRRDGPSYTIDTMRHFRTCYGPEAELYFITGVDAVIQIPEWKNAAGLFGICKFIAATRPGYPTENFFRFRDRLPARRRRGLKMLAVPALSISSSDLRQRVRQGRSIKYLVPEVVEQYILDNGLYRRKGEPVSSRPPMAF
ncbi:MAG: nicotinate-nucleotide adenylyltransferase [Bacillota bacterium]